MLPLIAGGKGKHDFTYRGYKYALFHQTAEEYGAANSDRSGAYIYYYINNELLSFDDRNLPPFYKSMKDALTIYIEAGGYASLTIEEYLNTLNL